MTNWEKYFGDPYNASITLSTMQYIISHGHADDLGQALNEFAHAPFNKIEMTESLTYKWLQQEAL